MKRINAPELENLFDSNEKPVLLDVREPHEVAYAKIDPHVHIAHGHDFPPSRRIRQRYPHCCYVPHRGSVCCGVQIFGTTWICNDKPGGGHRRLVSAG